MAKPGSIGWIDLTVDDASSISDFYCKVAGWRKEPLSMGDYDDFVMSLADGDDPLSGICHKRGTNAAQPGGWMLYIVVDALEDRVARCRELGGEVVREPKTMGSHGSYAIIRDPSGAHCALFEES